MPRTYTTTTITQMNSTAATDLPLILLEIDHADLATPVRVVKDNQDLTHQGNVFTAIAFRITLPDDMESSLPQATLGVDNVGRELMQWLESSNGGEGSTCRILQVRRSAPDVVEWETTMQLKNIAADSFEVSGQLGFEDLLGRAGISARHSVDRSPGLY